MGPSIPDALPAVLIVEDEAILRLVAMELAEDAGLAVFGAAAAAEGIAQVEAHPEIGIVFTDISMAGSMNGLAMSRVIHERWPSIKFMVTSGKVAPTASQMPSGAVFFAKPYDFNNVTETFRRLAAR